MATLVCIDFCEIDLLAANFFFLFYRLQYYSMSFNAFKQTCFFNVLYRSPFIYFILADNGLILYIAR